MCIVGRGNNDGNVNVNVNVNGNMSGAWKGSFGNMSSSPNQNKCGKSSNNKNTTNMNVPGPALGVTPLGRPPTIVSRIYFLVDLPFKLLPGPAIDVIPAISPTTATTTTTLHFFSIVGEKSTKSSYYYL